MKIKRHIRDDYYNMHENNDERNNEEKRKKKIEIGYVNDQAAE